MKNKSIKVYIVAGGHSVGKSSVIRYISGGRREKILRNLQTKKGMIDIFCKVMSLQEAGIMPSEVQEYINEKTSGRTYSAILVALRTDVTNGMPIAEDYIKEFVKLGWQIEGIVELVGCLRKYCKRKKFKYQSFQPIPPIKQLCNDVKTIFGF